MKTIYRSVGLLLLIAAFVVIPTRVTAEKQKLRFVVTLAPTLSSNPVSGRLIVFMTKSSESLQVIEPSLFDLSKVWVAAMEVHNLTPGKTIEFNGDDIASPAPLSTAPAGDYQLMALLDSNHSYSYSGIGEGDLRSEVTWARGLTPSESEPVQLMLTKGVEDEHPITDTETTKLITFQSPSLSAFWGKPVVMRAGVLLPPGYSTSRLRYPVIYRVHGFGGSYRSAWTSGAALYKKMADKKLP